MVSYGLGHHPASTSMLFMGNQPKLHNVASLLLIAVPYLVKFHWQKNQKRQGIHSNTQTAQDVFFDGVLCGLGTSSSA